MTADWTTCRVVRDREGDLWFRGSEGADADLWTANTNYPDVFLSADEVVTAFGPLVPVLDADGLPVATTVGDLTARHIGKRVRVEGCEYTLDHIGPSKCLFILGPGGYFPGQQFPLDTPCEVLP